MREVDADLVRAPGLQPRLDERGEAEALEDLPLGHGADPLLARLRDAPPAVATVLDEVLVEGSGVARQVALDDGDVAPVHRVRAELRLEVDEAAPAPREDEDAGRLLVEPVDDGDVRSPVPAAAPLHVARDAAAACRLPRLGRVGEEAGRLDDGDRVVVLVEDLERRVDAPLLAVAVPTERRVPRDDRAGVVHDRPVDRHLALEDGALEARRGLVGVERLEAADDAEAALGVRGRAGLHAAIVARTAGDPHA